MIPIKVYRAHWTFPELQEHFRISPLDLRRLVLSGALRPACHFPQALQPVVMEDGLPIARADERAIVKGWLWAVQESAEQYGNFDCRYGMVRDQPLHQENARYWALPDPITLDELLGVAVVLDGNVRAIEESIKEDPERDLSSREEKTRDKLIAAFAAERLQWTGGPLNFKGLTDFCDGAAALEIGVSYNTAKEHIQLAWERAKPKSLERKAALSMEPGK